MVRADVVKSLNLTTTDFNLDFELPDKILLAGYGILEIPISYDPRTYAEGKKNIQYGRDQSFIHHVARPAGHDGRPKKKMSRNSLIWTSQKQKFWQLITPKTRIKKL